MAIGNVIDWEIDSILYILSWHYTNNNAIFQNKNADD